MGAADVGRAGGVTTGAAGEPGANLSALLDAWTALLRTGSTHRLAKLLDSRIEWTGVLPGTHCHGRRWVLHYLRLGGTPAPRLTRMEAAEMGDRVVVSVESPDFPANEWAEAGTPRTLAFTFRDGRVVQMESYATRDLAFAAAG